MIDCTQEQQNGKKEEKAVNDIRLHVVTEDHEPKKEVVVTPTASPMPAKPVAAKPKGVKCDSTVVFNVRQSYCARYSYRLFVCLSVTRWYCVETAQPIVKLSSLPGSPVILVF